MTASTALVNEALVAVTALPCAFFWRANCGTFFTPAGQPVVANIPGTPDIIGALRGRPVAIECKTGSGKLRRAQIAWRAAATAAGYVHIEGWSVPQILAELATV